MLNKLSIIPVILLLTYSCLPKQKTGNDELGPIVKKEYEPNVDKRIAQSGGITLFSDKKESSFAKQNVMWRATLQTLNNFPITVASYEGGIIATDWYSSSDQRESIKIQVNFLSTSVAASSLEVLTYKKKCSQINEKDLKEIPQNVKDGLKIIPVKHVEEVLKIALVSELKPVEWVEIAQIPELPKDGLQESKH